MIPLDDQAVDMLARRFAPVLRFHEEERFFPVLAESWLTTATNGVWPEAAARTVQLGSRPDDPARRGGAFCRADPQMTAVTPVTGAPVWGDRPITFEVDPGDPTSMLSDLIQSLRSDGFLDVGGWRTDSATPFAEGDIDYLAWLLSELTSGVNPALPWNPPDAARPEAHGAGAPVVPWQWVAQPTHPTMYCEVNWGGAFARRAWQGGLPEFPAGERELDGTIAFTYHLLYGARDPGGAGRRSEGQWEAVTLFFRAEVGKGSRTEGELLPREAIGIAEEPFAVVASQGQDRSQNAHFTEARAYGACERLAQRPVIYVTKGSHRNLFAPVTGETWDPGQHGPHAPDTSGHDEEPATWDGVDEFLLLAGILLALAILLVILIAIITVVVIIVIAAILAVILVILALILFIMWIVSACDEASDEDAGESVSGGQEPNEAGASGPQSGGGDEEPAGPSPGSGGGSSGGGSSGGGGGGGGGGTVGLPNTGSPTGNETTFPDVRIVERLFEDGASREPTPFPAASAMENPTWWDWQGRWGVRVKPAPASGTWESGWQRVDEGRRDWSYFAGERLLISLHQGTISL